MLRVSYPELERVLNTRKENLENGVPVEPSSGHHVRAM